MLYSSSLDKILLGITTSRNTSFLITGKRIFCIISSPRSSLLTGPSASRFCLSHYFTAQQSTALNKTTSSMVKISLATTFSRTDRSIVRNSILDKMSFTFFSTKYQQSLARSSFEKKSACFNTENTFEI